MKKLLTAGILSVALLLSASPASAMSQWYKVNNPGYWVDIYSEQGYRKGRFRCRVPHGDYLQGFNIQNHLRYIQVNWMRRLGTMEWHWRDAMTGGWCPIWNRNGWVDKRLLTPVSKPGGHWIN